MTTEEALDVLYFTKNWGCKGDTRLHDAIEIAIRIIEEKLEAEGGKE